MDGKGAREGRQGLFGRGQSCERALVKGASEQCRCAWILQEELNFFHLLLAADLCFFECETWTM